MMGTTYKSNPILFLVIIILLALSTMQGIAIKNMADEHEYDEDSYWRQVGLSIYLAEKNSSFEYKSVGNGIIYGTMLENESIVTYGYGYDPIDDKVYEGYHEKDNDFNSIISGHLIKSP